MPLQTSGDRRLQLFKRLWPHFLIVSAAVGYLLLGGYLFYLIETRWALPSSTPPSSVGANNEPTLSLDPSSSSSSSASFNFQQQQQLLKKSRELNNWLCLGGDTINKVLDASAACKAWTDASTPILNSHNLSALLGDPLRSSPFKRQEKLANECETALSKLFECVHHRVGALYQQQKGGGMITGPSGRQTSTNAQEWSWTTGIILAFTIVTTIGYGKVTPQTSAGRLFCIIYGIFGIPLVLLALANQGRFFSSWLLFSYKNSKRFVRWLRHEYERRGRNGRRRFGFGKSKSTQPPSTSTTMSSTTGGGGMMIVIDGHHHRQPNDDSQKLDHPNNQGGFKLDDSTSLASSEEGQEHQTIPASVLLGLITAYLALGGYLIGEWESESKWSFIDSTYFVFTSASSIGFGDLVPQNRSRMALTFLYICMGLALTTTAIDIFAEYLRRLHYWGVKIKNVASTFVWFGGNKVTINQLVRTIGHELGASEDKIKTIVKHLDSVVSMAIQEADEQQEVVEDLQFVESLIPAANERLLVHQNSFEFAIAEASLLSPLIFSPPDHNVVVVNNNVRGGGGETNPSTAKRPSIMTNNSGLLEEMASMSSTPRAATVVACPAEELVTIDGQRLCRATASTMETIQFMDESAQTLQPAVVPAHHQQHQQQAQLRVKSFVHQLPLGSPRSQRSSRASNASAIAIGVGAAAAVASSAASPASTPRELVTFASD